MRALPIRPLPGAADIVPDAVLAGIAQRAAAADAGASLAPDIAALSACGALVAPLPVSAGGTGLATEAHGALPGATLLRRLGRASLPVARLYEGHVNAVKLVAVHGTAADLARCAITVRAGGLLAVWGADGDPPVTLADGRLAGTKRFASGLGIVAAALVTAATPAGPQLVLAPATDASRANPAVWRQSGMRATRSGSFDLSGLPAEPTIGGPGALFAEPHFEGGVWRYCAAHLGGAEALYGEMRDRLAASGRADDPHQARRIAEAATACETARLWIEAAALRVEAGAGDGDRAAAYALLAREATEAACLAVIDRVELALGVAAFDETGPVERIRRDLSLFLRQAAPDAKRSRAARALVATAALPEAL